jgi:hypothetical protein
VKSEIVCGRDFLPSDFGDVLANLATTSRAMDQRMLQLDSAGQKGPEITLEGLSNCSCHKSRAQPCGSLKTVTFSFVVSSSHHTLEMDSSCQSP